MSAVKSVTEVTKYIAGILKNDSLLRNITVRGQISNFKRYSSGHCYFDLKDKDSILKCVIWRSNADRMKFQPENDMQVLATGSIEVYERDGKYQFYVNRMQPDGIGELAIAFEQLKERLEKEGLFDPLLKKALPRFPKVIGVVTSPTGAVLRDIHKVSKRRMPSVRLVLYPVQVQGAGAAEQIAAGIDFFNKQYPVDVMIVGRGGGSMEDLWSFNEEVVVRSIFSSEIPVISAVGHETDFTLADFAADQRAATPSQAAELAVADINDVANFINSRQQRILLAAASVIRAQRQKVEALLRSSVLAHPIKMLEPGNTRLEGLRQRLEKAIRQVIKDKKQQLGHDIEKLELINPIGVLKRGYGIVHDCDGGIVNNIENINAGDNISVKLKDGEFDAKVQSVRKIKT
ncbi:MAG: exodeoxyribonuclease VII large subunit [Anaerovibrio sp.]|uniref:exodeoxyribonuclease VII large subunit n=1 Tax=Anaerovibrio sp. TaxID=1872532 RepID=UPI0025D24A7C|nr:exodeoxyribonuclease VII large subunit [Anaerovibrio sp.]MCR5175847.1 exodeoxyribonuclease VII large subunit [Anaerovibrio sp.]